MSTWDYHGKWVDVTPMVADQIVDYRAEDIPVGSVLRCTWKGDQYTVHVVPPTSSKQEHKGWWRYVYEGKRYKTLSAIAKIITGDENLSGNRLFRLRRRRR